MAELELVDANRIIQSLLTRDLLGRKYFIASDLDVDDIDLLPAVTHTVMVDGQTANWYGSWRAQLIVNVFDESSTAFDTCSGLYRIIHGWNRNGACPPHGSVRNVRDVSVFSEIPKVNSGSTMVGKHARHYAATFGLNFRTI